ncbi:MAG TPA: SRPBCC domain-containing protein [Gemmatimonadales bacterium]|nr:SRPBCC domain-containing protein [Gemmatimonadales bacterium]
MNATTEDLKLEIKRVLSAPIDRVFAAWTDPQSLRQFITPGNPGHADVECDVRVGGKFRIAMHGKDGKVFQHNGEYLEVLPPKRLKFTWISAATNQRPTVVTIDLKSLGDRTEVTLVHDGLDSVKNVEGHTKGWTEILQQLEAI